MIMIIIDHCNYIWLKFTNSSINKWSGHRHNSVNGARRNYYCSHDPTL